MAMGGGQFVAMAYSKINVDAKAYRARDSPNFGFSAKPKQARKTQTGRRGSQAGVDHFRRASSLVNSVRRLSQASAKSGGAGDHEWEEDGEEPQEAPDGNEGRPDESAFQILKPDDALTEEAMELLAPKVDQLSRQELQAMVTLSCGSKVTDEHVAAAAAAARSKVRAPAMPPREVTFSDEDAALATEAGAAATSSARPRPPGLQRRNTTTIMSPVGGAPTADADGQRADHDGNTLKAVDARSREERMAEEQRLARERAAQKAQRLRNKHQADLKNGKLGAAGVYNSVHIPPFAKTLRFQDPRLHLHSLRGAVAFIPFYDEALVMSGKSSDGVVVAGNLFGGRASADQAHHIHDDSVVERHGSVTNKPSALAAAGQAIMGASTSLGKTEETSRQSSKSKGLSAAELKALREQREFQRPWFSQKDRFFKNINTEFPEKLYAKTLDAVDEEMRFQQAKAKGQLGSFVLGLGPDPRAPTPGGAGTKPRKSGSAAKAAEREERDYSKEEPPAREGNCDCKMGLRFHLPSPLPPPYFGDGSI